MANTDFQPGVDTLVTDATAAAPNGQITVNFNPVPPAGVYQANITYAITGAVETAAQNLRLIANGATIQRFPTGAGVGAFYQEQIPRITLNGTNNVVLSTVAAAAASTVYTVTLALTRLEI